MKEKVLEIKITEINEEYSVWYITYQNEEVLPRGIFKDEELEVYSEEQAYINDFDNENIFYILGTNKKWDKSPDIIKNEKIYILNEIVDKINQKYGIEKFEIERLKDNLDYFYINENFEIYFDKELFEGKDDRRFEGFNYYTDREEALYCADKMKKYLLELRKEWRDKNGKE